MAGGFDSHNHFRRYWPDDARLFGSDWPVCLLAGSYAQVSGLARAAVAALSTDEQAAVLGGNAARVYGIKAGGAAGVTAGTTAETGGRA